MFFFYDTGTILQSGCPDPVLSCAKIVFSSISTLVQASLKVLAESRLSGQDIVGPIYWENLSGTH